MILMSHGKLPKPAAYINGVRPLACGRPLPQAEGVAWILAALDRSRGPEPTQEVKRARGLYARLLRSDAVSSRATCVEDYHRSDWSAMTLFRADGAGATWHQPPLEERMKTFRRQADLWADAAFGGDVASPDYLVQISCTGYDAPHAVQKLASRKGWGATTKVLHVGHMGCYASVPAVAMAAKLVAGEVKSCRAGLLFAEMCTLHLKPGASDDEQVVMNALFADGAARVDVSSTPEPGALALLDTAELLLEDSESEMTWTVSDSAFTMSLGRAVPARIKERAANFVDEFLGRHGLARRDVARFAVHPGGPKIIDNIAAALSLNEAAISHSRAVLRERGNMSSSTLPHIWAAMKEDPNVAPGDLIVSLAFGPGLTFVANLLQKLS
jgi:predicted naringenin-chalcone synthase